MVILHIANISDNKSVGPNINVPQNIIYGNKYANVGLYNLKDSNILFSLSNEKYFNIKDYKSIDELPKPFNNPDIVIFQGMYEIKHCFIAKQLKKRNIPYVIVPRCSLTTAALKNRVLKKKIANILFFNKFISNAKYIQFLTKNEYEESKNNFKIHDYFIVGNGVEMPKQTYMLKNRKEFKIVFIARYNVYHKGLDILLETIKNNLDWFDNNNVHLYLYGSDSDNGVEYLRNYIKENSLNKIVILNGPVYDNEKEDVLLDSDMFIHTSRLEGQPTAVIEAISYGIPVLVTPGTNIADIVKNEKLGFTCELSNNEIFNCIKCAYENKKSFEIISNNEIQYAMHNFDWSVITKLLIEKINKRESRNIEK